MISASYLLLYHTLNSTIDVFFLGFNGDTFYAATFSFNDRVSRSFINFNCLVLFLCSMLSINCVDNILFYFIFRFIFFLWGNIFYFLSCSDLTLCQFLLVLCHFVFLRIIMNPYKYNRVAILIISTRHSDLTVVLFLSMYLITSNMISFHTDEPVKCIKLPRLIRSPTTFYILYFDCEIKYQHM